MKKRLHKKILLIIFIVFILSTMIGSYKQMKFEFSNEDKNYNVLIVNSYDEKHVWENSIVDSFKNEIQKNDKLNINIKVEYLDYKSVKDQDYYVKYIELLKAKYNKDNIDVIFAIDDVAFYLMKTLVMDNECEFYKMPLIYAGVNSELILTEQERKNIIGFKEKNIIIKLMNIIYALNYQTSTINILLEDSLYCDMIKDEIDKTIRLGWVDIKVNIIQSNYIDEIINKLNEINNEEEDEPVIIAGEFRYGSNNKYATPQEVIEAINNIVTGPIYSTDVTYKNEDILGGIFDNGNSYGKKAAEIVVKILNEVPIESLANEFDVKQDIYFNYENIYKSDIDVFKIPDEAIFLNKPNYAIIVPSSVRVVVISVLIIFVVIIITLISYGIDKRTKLKVEKIEKERSKEREKLQSDFIVNMSHELRTPLNIILNSSKLMELKIKNNDFDEEYLIKRLNNINQNSNRLLKLVNNVIDITKVESGFLTLSLKNYNIVQVVEEVFEEVVDYAKKKNINVVFDTAEEEIITAIDKEKIERVVLNLLSNSIKYTEEGGNIYGVIRRENNCVEIEIKDNGVGIPEEKLSEVFHRFYQVESSLSRSNEGSGIGLCIVRELTYLHGGKIEVKSKVGKGTKFIIILPIKEVDSSLEEESKIITNLASTVNMEMSDVHK